MHQAMVTDRAQNQHISNDDYLAEMAVARTAAQLSLGNLRGAASQATLDDARQKRATLAAAVAEVERRYLLYRAIPYEADAHEVGDAAEEAFKGWP
jgi:TnpA family transposase